MNKVPDMLEKNFKLMLSEEAALFFSILA